MGIALVQVEPHGIESLLRLLRFITASVFLAVSVQLLTACSPGLDAGDKVVRVYAPFFDASADAFKRELSLVSARTGIQVVLETPSNLNDQIDSDIKANSLPDIVIWDNPRDLLNHSDKLVALEQLVNVASIKDTLISGWAEVASQGEKTFGLPVSSNIKTGNKSLVFYSPKAFERNGYAVPTNGQELLALTEQIKKDKSGYPWCAGIESGGATGWPATDWLEQYVLEQAGQSVYNQWISGKVSFDSQEVSSAASTVSELLLSEGSVYGGGVQMSKTSFGETTPLFSDGGLSSGQCFMFKQGSFLTDFFPTEIQAEVLSGNFESVNAFALPPLKDSKRVVIGDGFIASAFVKDSDVSEVLRFVLSDQFGMEMVKSVPFLSPHKTFDVDAYPAGFARLVGRATAEADLFGFDASTAMPRQVNEQFWIAVASWIRGESSWPDAAQAIDASYPR
ncbi:MAG: extracellular solute-binding protein [Actinobacteria bacterium]|nr:extracellular solute-binding protein [Actinomycetota bacterium]